MAKKDAEKTPEELLREIEQAERDAYEEFERKQKERREKALAAVIEPLREERATLAQSINEANTRIGEIDRQLAKLTGQKLKEHKATAGKRRPRMSDDEKIERAKIVVEKMKASKGNKFRPGELESFIAPLKMREIVDLWNDKGAKDRSEKIHKEGDKATTRYFIAA
jgi:chromosome segregation ATPase